MGSQTKLSSCIQWGVQAQPELIFIMRSLDDTRCQSCPPLSLELNVIRALSLFALFRFIVKQKEVVYLLEEWHMYN